MNKKIVLAFPLLAVTFLFSGCSLTGIGSSSAKNPMSNATFIRSDDDGTNWNPKIKINDKKDISGIDVLSMAVNPQDPNNIYLGTTANGLFMSKDGGETWVQVPFANKAYGLVFDPSNPNVMYGSGIFNGRAKIYKRIQEGQEWKEIYTEPSDGTIISSLAISQQHPSILYAGISNGAIIKSIDGGQTWTNLKVTGILNSPITSIVFDAANDAHVFFLAFQAGLLETKTGGAVIENISDKVNKIGAINDVYSLTSDPYFPGVLYLGTGSGIYRRLADGSWSSLNIIESSKAFPIRALAINPKNSREIIYSSAKAIYKTTDAGITWATFQLNTNKEIGVLQFNQQDPTKIFGGLRSY